MEEFMSVLENTDYTDFIEDSIDTALLEVGIQGIPDKGSAEIKRGKYTKIKIINTIIHTLKKILDMFRTKASDMMGRSTKFLNKIDVNRFNYSKIDLNLDIYYFKSQDLVSNFTNSNLFRNLTNKNSYNPDWIRRTFGLQEGESITMEKIIKHSMFKSFVADSGSLSEGCKSYFRFGLPTYEQRTKQLSISEIKFVVDKAYSYCKNYTKIVNTLSSSNKKIQDTLKSLENTQSLNESTNWYDEDMIGGFDTLIFENGVEDNKMGGNEGKSDLRENTPKSNSGIETQFIKNSSQILQIMLTSAMTVAEERFNTYMNILKYCSTKSYGKTEAGDVIDSEKRSSKDEYEKEKGIIKKSVDKGAKKVASATDQKINDVKRTVNNTKEKIKNKVFRNKE